jgi:hypothetical protein
MSTQVSAAPLSARGDFMALQSIRRFALVPLAALTLSSGLLVASPASAASLASTTASITAAPEYGRPGQCQRTRQDLDGDCIRNNRDRDIDGDGVPNRRDRDIDGDGIVNRRDRDMDGDGIVNRRDRDMDGDGTPNSRDRDPQCRACRTDRTPQVGRTTGR